jgi:predicted metal-dependent phosphoesterase TrpH
VLVEKNYVGSVQEAFDKYLAAGAAAHVDKKRVTPAEAIALIHAAGGLAVLAHPVRLKGAGSAELDGLVAELVEQGLDGVEVYYSDHSPELTEQLLALAKKFNVLVFGGSDFHGQHKPGIDLGVGRGNLRIPESLLEPIERRVKCKRH